MKAFPSKPTHDLETNRTVWNDGMELRDYFAAKAMQSFLAGCDDINNTYSENGISIMAYKMADAMIKEREK